VSLPDEGLAWPFDGLEPASFGTVAIDPPSKPPCSVDDCRRPRYARGWCTLHYDRWRRAGGLEDRAPEVAPPAPEPRCSPLGDLEAGTAGEHLVVADLLLSGYRAMITAQEFPYDVVVEAKGRLVRIQVKSARAPRDRQINQQAPAYIWSVKKHGKARRRQYSVDAFDVLACVALDIRAVGYVAVGQMQAQHVQVRVPGWEAPPVDSRGRRRGSAEGRHFRDLTIEQALDGVAP